MMGCCLKTKLRRLNVWGCTGAQLQTVAQPGTLHKQTKISNHQQILPVRSNEIVESDTTHCKITRQMSDEKNFTHFSDSYSRDCL